MGDDQVVRQAGVANQGQVFAQQRVGGGAVAKFVECFSQQRACNRARARVAFLPMTIVLMAVNLLAGRPITRMGARYLMVLGLLLAALGYLMLLPVRIGGAYWPLAPPMLLAASGIALMVPT
ncbi:hypothetical protein ACU4GI_18615 [Cupriavidus basilensis]